MLEECARPREPGDGVWITERLQAPLSAPVRGGPGALLRDRAADGELAAGLVGVLLGRAAMLESMFHRVPDAGNVLLARTLDELAARGFVLCDIQLPTDHTTRMGARLVRARGSASARLAGRPQLSDGSAGMVESSAYSRPLRRSTRDHSPRGRR